MCAGFAGYLLATRDVLCFASGVSKDNSFGVQPERKDALNQKDEMSLVEISNKLSIGVRAPVMNCVRLGTLFVT